jgi:urease accessory protein UreE
VTICRLARRLHDGDGLVLEDGALVRVAGKPESLFEINAASAHVRLAWHIGNRHTDLQVIGSTLRIRRDGVLGDMLRGLLDANDLLRAVDMFDLQPHHFPGRAVRSHKRG